MNFDNVFYVFDFKFNFFLVGMLIEVKFFVVSFIIFSFMFYDFISKYVVVVGKGVNGLYKFRVFYFKEVSVYFGIFENKEIVVVDNSSFFIFSSIFKIYVE